MRLAGTALGLERTSPALGLEGTSPPALGLEGPPALEGHPSLEGTCLGLTTSLGNEERVRDSLASLVADRMAQNH